MGQKISFDQTRIFSNHSFSGMGGGPGCVKHFAEKETLYRPVGIPVVDFAEPFDDDNEDGGL